jgi:leucyl aminopeptidase
MISLYLHTISQYQVWLKKQTQFIRNYEKSQRCNSNVLVFPDENGQIHSAHYLIDDCFDPWDFAAIRLLLPDGEYEVCTDIAQPKLEVAALSFELEATRFDRFKLQKMAKTDLQLKWPNTIDTTHLHSQVEAIQLVRDLITTPANKMGPEALADRAKILAKELGAHFSVMIGEDLIKNNYPAIHAVGAAGDQAPRLVDISWGKSEHPLIALVGKGVTFDTGGLNLKPASGMRLMCKDMGGAAHALGLAKLIIEAKLPVRLRVLLPIVENAVAGKAMRPGDILSSRSGKTIEIGNTDAEGRVILADALFEASNDKPALIVDFTTLTGAARIALGHNVPAVFTTDKTLISQLISIGEDLYDPVWPLPLYQPYKIFNKGKFADLTNSGDSNVGGAITAALFLQEFVDPQTPWVHLDLMGWNIASKPGRPEGGEAMGLRTIFHLLKGKFGKN